MDFERRFSSEDACRQYLFGLRWPGGFICPQCAGRTAWQATRGRWVCGDCRHQATVTAGTIFQDSHLPMTTWFRAMWYVTSQKNGASALGIQRVLGLGSYKTAWALLHKLRRAMVRPGRDRLKGIVEADETYWGREEEGVVGRLTEDKAIIAVAAEEDGKGIGRIRFRCVPDLTKASLHGFIREAIEPGSTVRTDGLNAYLGLDGYVHDRTAAASPGRRRTPAASRTSRSFASEALAVGHPPGRHWTRTFGLLPRRVHVPFQPSYISLTWKAVLPTGTTGSTSISGSL